MSKVHEHHHHGNHSHAHHTEAPVISRLWKWATVAGNGAIGLANILAGRLDTLTVTAEGVHSLGGDMATFYMQANNILNPDLTDAQRYRRRKIAHWMISTSSAAVGAQAIVDLSLNHERSTHSAAIYTASASLALSGVLVTSLHKKIKRRRSKSLSADEHDLLKHFWRVDIPSAGLAVAGAILQKYNANVEQLATVVSSVIGAHAFRPTRPNLENSCIDHDHAAGMADSHTHAHEGNARTTSRWRRATALGATVLTLAGGLVSSTQSGSTEQEAPGSNVPVATAPDVPREPVKEPAVVPMPVSITECVPIETGDSQWSIIQKQVRQQIGHEPTVAATNAITVFTAMNNVGAAPNPNEILPGGASGRATTS